MILRTKDHAAFYDPSSNELSLQKRFPPRSEAPASDANLVSQRSKASLLQRYTRRTQMAGAQDRARCPTCAQPWPLGNADIVGEEDTAASAYDRETSPSFIAPNYFRLLAQATTSSTHSPASGTNQGYSSSSGRPATPTFLPRNRFSPASGSSTPLPPSSGASTPPEPINLSSSAQGYYSRFFVELKQLGRGARGQVFLCQHVLNGNKLGKYAIKKIPVGDHAQSLLQSLNEVHLMETLHHPHLVHYQHAWIERCQLSPFAPEVPTLFVLMMAANGGSLADWISARAGEKATVGDEVEGAEQSSASGISAEAEKKNVNGTSHREQEGSSTSTSCSASVNPAERRKIERLKAALRQRRANRTTVQPSAESSNLSTCAASATTGGVDMEGGVGVHLLREDEILSLLADMTSGLSFLHDRGILHLDIKPGNVLLHWDEDSLLPRALLSDFGSSLLLHDSYTRTRSGHTGTMEYMSPETVIPDPHTGVLRELGSKADIWSLGMILHLLLFFRLPYGQTDDVERLRDEMRRYRGFRKEDEVGMKARGARKGEGVLLGLLERMLNVDPGKRPSCKEVLQVLNAAKDATVGQGDGLDSVGKKARRRAGHDAEEAAAASMEGRVSLALYRPTALPPLARVDSHPSSPLLASSLSPTTSCFANRYVPHQAAPIAIALFKCFSPSLLAHLFATRPPDMAPPLLPSNAASTLILLLALVDLSSSIAAQQPQAQPTRFTRVSAFCWTAHFALLWYIVSL